MEQALKYLNSLLNRGVEFPDAVYHVATRLNVNWVELQFAYDEQFK